jgi:hypothetical protein
VKTSSANAAATTLAVSVIVQRLKERVGRMVCK